ncbi:apolipoprotein N-acyltransferase [Nonomuraea turcica]|uniref:apolipoprotein N-acyltransferase n=1 Tax=Nonomuraea sp. G32 TaxID=3067274 RepID=UPI00273AE21E|nr:apolipoprotein N-acyltransferase [Nonomuraea sp. G32]MDP4505186.1 apolipoprotein N-acyltransferase [Nonomuraea sp. G32]
MGRERDRTQVDGQTVGSERVNASVAAPAREVSAGGRATSDPGLSTADAPQKATGVADEARDTLLGTDDVAPATGQDATGQDAVRQDATRQDAVRQDATEQDTARLDAARLDAAEQDAVRQDAARQDAARLHAARLDATEQDAARLDAVREDAARLDAAREDTARLDVTRQDAVRQDATGQDAASGTPAGGGAAPPTAAAAPGRGGRETRKVLAARVVAAVAGGITLFAAFPPLGWWWCAPLGIALIAGSLYGARPRRAAWLGYLSAAVFLFPALAWVRTIGDDVWLMLVGTESLFYAAMAALAALVFRLPGWPVWFGGLWVAMEWARGLVPIGGFPWARVAFSQGESLFTPYAAFGGAPLVSFAATLSGALLAHSVLVRSRAWRRAVPVGLALAVPVLTLAIPRPGDEGRSINVGVVQGNVPGRGMYALGDEPAVVLKNHANETKRLAEAVRAGKLPKPDIVILPENSTDIDPYQDEVARQIIHDSVRDVGVPTLVGAVVAIGEEHRATRSLVWDPVTGAGAYYDKQNLVPFGEYTPFKDIVLALWERAGLVGRQSVPGGKPGDLKMGPVTVGAVNCYEVAYDDTVRRTVRAGGTPLVVQTNNASYALSNLPPQQLAMSQLRAVEHNRAVVTAATTGISAFVTPDGKVAWQTRELVADMNVVKVPVRTQETLATKVGALPEWALMVMGAAAAAVAAWRARRRGDQVRND